MTPLGWSQELYRGSRIKRFDICELNVAIYFSFTDVFTMLIHLGFYGGTWTTGLVIDPTIPIFLVLFKYLANYKTRPYTHTTIFLFLQLQDKNTPPSRQMHTPTHIYNKKNTYVWVSMIQVNRMHVSVWAMIPCLRVSQCNFRRAANSNPPST
jgi:hypothetical protein